MYCLGNMSVLGGADTGEPFIIGSVPAQGVTMVMDLLGTYSSVYIAITGEIETVHGLEGKYLPEGTPYLEEFDDVIVENLTFNESGMSQDAIGTVTVGTIYNVNWGGVIYPCLARKISMGSSEYVCLGNGSLSDNNLPVTAEPFLIHFVPAEWVESIGGTALALADSFPDNISIIGGKKGHKMDTLCLPDNADTLVIEIHNTDSGLETSTKWADAYDAFSLGKDLILKWESGIVGHKIYRLVKYYADVFYFAAFSLEETGGGLVEIDFLIWKNLDDVFGRFERKYATLEASITSGI